MSWRNPIIVALDLPSEEAALRLAKEVAPAVGAFKIGSELFTNSGPDIVRRIRAMGASVFLDLKFHDIPNTVAKAVTAALRLDIQMLTVHTSGGVDMMKAAEEMAQRSALESGQSACLILGVTVLTSLDDGALTQIGFSRGPTLQVQRLAELAVRVGLRGLVCSPQEITALRKILPSHVRLVTPGIRSAEDRTDDQKRTLTAKQAMDAGADWLVVGRPIYAQENPRAAAEQILKSLS